MNVLVCTAYPAGVRIVNSMGRWILMPLESRMVSSPQMAVWRGSSAKVHPTKKEKKGKKE
jgi:hypothetical protein